MCLCMIGSRKGSRRRRAQVNFSVADGRGTLDALLLSAGLRAPDLGRPDSVPTGGLHGLPGPGTREGNRN